MNSHQLIKKLKSKVVLNLTKGPAAWSFASPPTLAAFESIALELWICDTYMLEGFTEPLSAANLQLMELAGEDVVFQFEEWNHRRLPSMPEGEKLRVRLIHHPVIKQIIEGFRAPVVATPSRLNEGLETYQLEVSDFWPSPRPKQIQLSKDGSFRILR